MEHGQTFLQSIFESSTKISPQVHAMLAELNQFRVHAFRPFHAASTDDVPLQERMQIMSQAVVTLVLKSVPKTPGDERDRCRARVRLLSEAFKVGVTLLTHHSMVNMKAMNDPPMAELITQLIDEDMAAWTRKVQIAVATLGHDRQSPPGSERELSPIPVPEWVTLKAFFDSGALVLANESTKSKPGTPKAVGGSTRKQPATKVKDCRRFLQGKCNKANCKYRHRATQAVASSQPKGGDKWGASKPATTHAPKKAKGAKTPTLTKGAVASSQPKGGDKRGASKPATIQAPKKAKSAKTPTLTKGKG